MMNPSAQSLIECFDQLPDAEKQKFASEILKRTINFEMPALSDEELVLSAEGFFSEPDRKERKMPHPNRGEVWLIDLGYAAKVRPCLVLSIPALDEDRALATLVAHTTRARGSRFEIDVTVRFLRAGVFDA